MRVTNQMVSRMLSGYITTNQAQAYLKEQQVASGKRMQKSSDDPQAWSNVVQTKRDVALNKQYERNSVQLTGRLEAIDQTLKSISNLLSSASETAVMASDGTRTAEDRDVMAQQVDQLLEQLVLQSNSKYDGKYVFGGVQTEVAPFSVTRDAEGRIDAVSYAGGASSSSMEIAEGNSVPSTYIGSDPDSGVFISTKADSFAALIDMRDRLLSGENLAETGVQEVVDHSFSQVLSARATTGGYLERLSFMDNVRADEELRLKGSIDDLEGLDVAEAVSELAAKQSAYQAALAVSSQAMSTSLLKYM